MDPFEVQNGIYKKDIMLKSIVITNRHTHQTYRITCITKMVSKNSGLLSRFQHEDIEKDTDTEKDLKQCSYDSSYPTSFHLN